LPKNTYGDLVQLNNGGAGIPAALQRLQDGLGTNTGLALSTTQIGIGGTDLGLKRLAAAVAAVTDGGATNLGWLQEAGYAALAANFTDAIGTLINTNLSFTVIAGRSYQISGLLQVSNSLAADGSQFNFAGGACTATTFFMACNNIGSVVAGTVTSTTLAGVINYTTNTGTDYLVLSGYLKVNAGGTFIMKAATNTHVSGTMTLGAGSWLALTDTPTL